MQLSQEGFQNFFRGVVNPLVYPAMIYTCVDESNSSTHSLHGLYYSGAIHKGRPQNLTPLSPVSAYVGLLLSKINSSVRSRQTPIPLLVRMCFMDDPSLIYKYAAHARTLPCRSDILRNFVPIQRKQLYESYWNGRVYDSVTLEPPGNMRQIWYICFLSIKLYFGRAAQFLILVPLHRIFYWNGTRGKIFVGLNALQSRLSLCMVRARAHTVENIVEKSDFKFSAIIANLAIIARN